ncbi:hypothetical protein A2116_00760 [Candidatus Jorgensenbacteria bacterium GWA1_49_17]|uniref:Uncharacterized protein n=2 Tax=Candidatus Joergenseniibacteriota TaxID=1752739 RepID=A0A1F6BRL5_9BACT|nr:MAG: hypothetical protein A2127_01680 [Candidatus Jorgensenbacteria bacterium GWC1_48_12]OGG40206.1 MAG: hypothetical protein A2116_00760 [Candidatus Jorgensenbacteria bacterium GWA1_49_17]
MSTVIKKVAIVAGIVVVAVGLYWGALLPYRKAKAFIGSVRALQSVKTVQEVESRFQEVLDIASPVGHDETVGFVVEQLTNVIRSRPPEEVGRLIVDYAEEVSHPVLADSQSPELTKMILKMGIVYQAAWLLYADETYAGKAEELYLEGLKISPNRPQFLYGLFDLYASGGRRAEAIEIGKEIVRFWPNDSLLEQKLRLLGYIPE